MAEARRAERVDLAIDPRNANAVRLLEEFSWRNQTAALPAGWQQYMQDTLPQAAPYLSLGEVLFTRDMSGVPWAQVETGLRVQLLGAQSVVAYEGWTPLGALVVELIKTAGLERPQAYAVVRVCVRQRALRDDGYAFGVTNTMGGWWVKAYPQLAAGRRFA